MMKTIRLSQHALGKLVLRGVSKAEVEKAITSSRWSKIEGERFNCQLDFDFKSEWQGKYYNTKRVKPIFVEEKDEIVVITVYSFYF